MNLFENLATSLEAAQKDVKNFASNNWQKDDFNTFLL
jgi:hypothetical protein